MPRRRSPGEGTVSKRADGRWEGQYELPPEGGKRKRGSVYGASRREALTLLADAIRERDRGLSPDRDRLTLGEHLDDWLARVAAHQVAASTLESYAGLVARHIAPAVGHRRLAQLSGRDLAGLYSRLLAGGLSPASVRKVHAVLHRALDQARRWRLVERNAADDADPPRLATRRPPVLSEGQVETFLRVAEADEDLWALYVLALTSGARQGELLGLAWSDVDWADRSIRIDRQARRTKAEGLVLADPKTARGRRSIPLPAWAMAALAWHRDRQAERRAAAGDRWRDRGLVFPNGVGGLMERHNLMRRSFRAIALFAELPAGATFHDLRHSNATLLLARGVNPKVVQERLGHGSVAITLDIYSHVLPSVARAAADVLDDLGPTTLRAPRSSAG